MNVHQNQFCTYCGAQAQQPVPGHRGARLFTCGEVVYPQQGDAYRSDAGCRSRAAQHAQRGAMLDDALVSSETLHISAVAVTLIHQHIANGNHASDLRGVNRSTLAALVRMAILTQHGPNQFRATPWGALVIDHHKRKFIDV